MNSTLKVEITKSQTGWSIYREVQYPEFTHPARTSSGTRTLNTALWKTLDPRDYVENIELISLTVNGQPMTPADAYKRIEKELKGGIRDYTLPRYKSFLK